MREPELPVWQTIPGKHRMKPTRADSERFCSQARFGKRGNTLCIARFSNRRLRTKDPLLGRRRFYLGLSPIKRERGECVIHPAVAPVSLLGAYSVCFDLRTGASGGQNLAALRTTASQNLTAVGSSHSLAETMNLGTVTTAGLIGTLHNTYTSCQKSICSTVRFDRSNTNFVTFTVTPDHYNRKTRFGQYLFPNFADF